MEATHRLPVAQLGGPEPANRRRKVPLEQPLGVINIPGALLKVETLAAISGRSIATLYKDARAGRLHLTKRGARCTRVTSESARAYLELLAKGAA